MTGGGGGVVRYQYHPLWYQVPCQKLSNGTSPEISRREVPGNFFQVVHVSHYLKHVAIEHFEKVRSHISYNQFQRVLSCFGPIYFS